MLEYLFYLEKNITFYRVHFRVDTKVDKFSFGGNHRSLYVVVRFQLAVRDMTVVRYRFKTILPPDIFGSGDIPARVWNTFTLRRATRFFKSMSVLSVSANLYILQ